MYLSLVLGIAQMKKHGLGGCLPKRKCTKGNPRSLIAPSNRNMDKWDFSSSTITQDDKAKMLGLLVQIMVLLLTTTTCYKFGGKVYRQKNGLGIGLRGSAALARLVMCCWDAKWGAL